MGLKVLSALDAAKTQYYHFQAIIVAGMGMFTDAYDLFCLPPILRIIARIYYFQGDINQPCRVPDSVNYPMVAIALFGTVIGKLLFGHLGDRIGRRRVYGFALMLMVFSSVGCGFSICTSPPCVLASLGFFRFLLGVAIGGDYPLSATIMSEYANKKTRGALLAAVFSMQGQGILASSAVTMVVCAIFDATSPQPKDGSTPKTADFAWRIILMIGAIPAGLTLYWRLMMPETARYTALVENNVEQAAKDMEKVLSIPLSQILEEPIDDIDDNDDQLVTHAPTHPLPSNYPFFSKQFFRRHGRDLFSCAATWFLLDVVFYSTNLVSSVLFNNYAPTNNNVSAYREAFLVARFQALLTVFSTIPGYWFTVYFIDRIGRVKIQMMGFFFMALALFAIGIPYSLYWHDHPDNKIFLFLYGLTFFFSNFGPNTTTFIVPAELFPARFRATCHGISGAFGKVGALIGAVGFLWALDRHNKEKKDSDAIHTTGALLFLGGVCIVGMIITYLFTLETMGRSLEENEKYNQPTQELCFLRCFNSSCNRPEPVADDSTE